MKPGLYWAEKKTGGYDLVAVENGSYRPESWFKAGELKIEVFVMGWDCPVEQSRYKAYVEANLIAPDGSMYGENK